MRRGAPYIRISKAKDGSTLGIERQLPPIIEKFEQAGVSIPAIKQGMTIQEIIAELHRGNEVPGVFCDNDLSGYSGKRRPAYEQMLAEAQAGDWEVLGAWHADRFTRQPIENEGLIELAERHGVELLTVTGQHDLSTPSGRLHFRMLGSIARYESEHKAERLRLKHDELAAAGKWQGGRRPFGYVVVGSKLHGTRDDCTETDDDRCGLFRCHLEVEPREAAMIQAAKDRVIAGRSLTPITRQWTALGTRNATTTSQVRAMLTSPRLAGLRRAKIGEDEHGNPIVKLVDADWPGIISREEHEQLVAKLSDPKGSREPQPRTYLLTGFAHHAEPCGAKLRARPNRLGQRAYHCDPDRNRGGCGHLLAKAEPIEDEVRDRVISALASPKLRAAFERYHARKLAAGEAARLRDQLAVDKAKLAQLELLAEDLGAAANDARAKIEQRIRTAKVRLQAGVRSDALAHLPKDAAGLRAYWDGADLDQRRAVLRLVLRRVELTAGGKGKRFDPDRVKCDWLV
jgi:DNA invertase Pin-like site-specific DNA recombinase